MATSTKSPLRVKSNNTVGTEAWATPQNAVSDNATRASAALAASEQSEYIWASDFAFTIPTNAVIDGIQVEIDKSRTAGTGTLDDTSIYLVRRSEIMSSAANRQSQGLSWTATDAYSTYGGTTDLWGIPWIADDINRADFGVVFSCSETGGAATATAGIDHIRIIVSYTTGYVATPRVHKPDEIILFGQRYRLAHQEDGSPGVVNIGLASTPPPKVVTNRDYSRETHPFQSSTGGNSFIGGMGHWSYRYGPDGQKLNPNTFWVGENLDPFWNTIGPLPVDTNAPGTDKFLLVADVFANADEELIVTDSVTPRGYNYQAGVYTAQQFIINTSTVYDWIRFNGRIFFAGGDDGTNGYIYQTATTAVSAVAVNTTNPGVISWAVLDDKLWAVDKNYKLWMSTTGNVNTWDVNLATLPIMTSAAFGAGGGAINLVVFDNLQGEPTLHCHTPEGVFAYDAVNNVWQRTRFQVPTINNRVSDSSDSQHHGNPHRAEVFQNYLFVQTDRLTIWRLAHIGGRLVAEDVSPNKPDGTTVELDGTIKYLRATDQLLFATFGDLASGTTKRSGLYAFNGQGWMPLAAIDGTLNRQQNIGITSTTLNRRVWWSMSQADGATPVDVFYLDLALLYHNPYFSTTKTYASSAFVELPCDDLGYPEQIKTAHTFRMKISGSGSSGGLVGTETVQVAYRINYSTGSYTNLGDPIAVNEEVRLPFGTDDVGLDFKSIQYRFTFARGSTNTDAPIIDYWVTECVRKPETLRSYIVTIDASKPYNGKTPNQQMDMIWAHMNSGLLGTFAWRDDAGNTRSSLVRLIAPQGQEAAGKYPMGHYTLHFIECGSN